MKKVHRLVLFLCLLGGGAHAGTITSAGTLSDLTPPGFGSGTDIADLDTNTAGQEGFVLFNSQPEGTNVAGQPWDQAIVDSKPAYISAIDGSAAASSGGWANYDDVLVGGVQYNTGGIVLSPGAGTEVELFRFTFGAGAPTDLRVGIIADNSDNAVWDAANVRIAQDGAIGVTANQDLNLNGALDVAQFDINNPADGEVYVVYATQPPGAGGALLGGITFDLPPNLDELNDPTSTDGDTLGDNWENHFFGDLTTADDTTNSDTDGLTDLEEWNVLINNDQLVSPLQDDTDSDGLTDDAEFDTHSTDPTKPDTDGDNLLDAFEVNGGLNPNDASGDNGETGDPDTDGLNNIGEQTRGTHPNNDDTDSDGLKDLAEDLTGIWSSSAATGTDPLNPDTDGDGLADGVENPDESFNPANPVTQPGTNPNVWDSDLDGVGDGNEANNGSDPTDSASTPPPSPNVLSADFQGIPGIFPSTPILMSGGTQLANFLSGTWNALDITGHDGSDTDPSWTGLVNAQGNPTNVGFSVTGTISSWTNTDSGAPIYDDYLFVNAGFADPSMAWEITGLNPNSSYEFFPYGAIARDFSITVDTDGDGDLGDEVATRIPPQSGVMFSVTSNASGSITGTMDPGNSGEANWGGFEIKGALPGASQGGIVIQNIDYDGEDVFLTWTSTPGALYNIEASTDLQPENWTPILTGVNAAGAPATTTTQLVDTPGESIKFYRVVQQ